LLCQGFGISIRSILQPDAFQIAGVDPELGSALSKIGFNSSLQPASKLQTSLKIVQKHYEKLLAATGEAFDRALSENQDLSNLFNLFLIEVSVAGTGNPVRLSDVLTTDAGKDLIDQIERLRSEIHKHDFCDRFRKFFGGPTKAKLILQRRLRRLVMHLMN
jgi:hypothetical protein